MTASSNYTFITEALYVAYFGRPADLDGWSEFSSQLASDDTSGTATTLVGLANAAKTVPSIASLVNSFGTSAESQALYGSGTTAQFVTAVFENLFDRAPAASGLNFWVSAISTGQVTQAQAALQIAAGAQGADITTINNKVAVSTDFTNLLYNQVYTTGGASYQGADAAAIGRGLLSTVSSTTAINSPAFQSNIYNTFAATNFLAEDVGGPSTSMTLPSHQPGLLFTNITGYDGEIQQINGVLSGDNLKFDFNALGNTVNNVTAAQVASVSAAYNHADTNALVDLLTAAVATTTGHGVAAFVSEGNTYVVNIPTTNSIVDVGVVELVGVHTITPTSTPGVYHIT